MVHAMLARWARASGWMLFGCFALLCALISVMKEPDAQLLTPSSGWRVEARGKASMPLSDYPPQYVHVRSSIARHPEALVHRTYQGERGNLPIEVFSPVFRPMPFMGVLVTGSTRSPGGSVSVHLECLGNNRSLPVFSGSVNANVTEAIVMTPKNWCAGDAQLHFTSSGTGHYAGVGSVYALSWKSVIKASFAGRLLYLAASLGLFMFFMLAGTSLVLRFEPRADSLPAALLSLGFFASISFAFHAWASAWQIPLSDRSYIQVGLVMIGLLSYGWAGKRARQQALAGLRPFVALWALAAFGYFSVACLTYHGLAHWEPNYRFWPASWSSDNELPWFYAQALRHDSDLGALFGGGWLPTDRPPLMTGAHLLVADTLELLQYNNDGRHLLPQTFNAAALSLNLLWLPVLSWLLSKVASLDRTSRILILLWALFTPFIVFNTIYGWPKFFGAAFALTAFGLAWRLRTEEGESGGKLDAIGFFLLCSFSYLAHASTALFIAPMMLLLLGWPLKRLHSSILAGATISLLLLFAWAAYKHLVLPSDDPVTKYALTGDFGFGQSGRSLLSMVLRRYADLEFFDWLSIKRAMALQSFWPVHHSITQIGLNNDPGMDWSGALRAWDFLMLSKGNMAVPICAVMSWVSVRRTAEHKSIRVEATHSLSRALLLFAAAAWFLMVCFFIAPVVLHHWPQAALIALLAGGGIGLSQTSPFLFRILVACTAGYTLIVWGVAPLRDALIIDYGAVAGALGIALLAGYTLRHVALHKRQMETERSSDEAMTEQVSATKEIRAGRNWFLMSSLRWSFMTPMLTLAAFAYLSYWALGYLDQPLFDAHAFRQTQTAISAFWLLRDGWHWRYETPTVGFPWAIPFEFPLYQAVVAGLVKLSGMSLDAAGRLVSYLFTAAFAWPAFSIARTLKLRGRVPWIFLALLWTAPLHVYWGRTFMIETAATFLALVMLSFFLAFKNSSRPQLTALGFVVFGILAVLQKATTAGPILLFLLLLSIWRVSPQYRSPLVALRAVIGPAILISVVLAAGLSWAHFADVVKMDNPFGAQLTSRALQLWNFGSLAQRLDPQTWILLLWQRAVGANLGGIIGLLVLIGPMTNARFRCHYGKYWAGALILFLLPFLIFTNLHVVHDYYQVACIPFLLAAAALGLAFWVRSGSGGDFFLFAVLSLLMLSNVTVFANTSRYVVVRTLDQQDKESARAFKVGRYLRDATPIGSAIAVFGQGYSSEIPYQSQRKAMVVPPWFSQYSALWENPHRFLGGLDLSALVVCHSSSSPTSESPFPARQELLSRLERNAGWRHVEMNGCDLALKGPGATAWAQ